MDNNWNEDRKDPILLKNKLKSKDAVAFFGDKVC